MLIPTLPLPVAAPATPGTATAAAPGTAPAAVPGTAAAAAGPAVGSTTAVGIAAALAGAPGAAAAGSTSTVIGAALSAGAAAAEGPDAACTAGACCCACCCACRAVRRSSVRDHVSGLRHTGATCFIYSSQKLRVLNPTLVLVAGLPSQHPKQHAFSLPRSGTGRPSEKPQAPASSLCAADASVQAATTLWSEWALPHAVKPTHNTRGRLHPSRKQTQSPTHQRLLYLQ